MPQFRPVLQIPKVRPFIANSTSMKNTEHILGIVLYLDHCQWDKVIFGSNIMVLQRLLQTIKCEELCFHQEELYLFQESNIYISNASSFLMHNVTS